jgi:hypothetical protein
MQCEHHAIIPPKCGGTDHIIAVFAPPCPWPAPPLRRSTTAISHILHFRPVASLSVLAGDGVHGTLQAARRRIDRSCTLTGTH